MPRPVKAAGTSIAPAAQAELLTARAAHTVTRHHGVSSSYSQVRRKRLDDFQTPRAGGPRPAGAPGQPERGSDRLEIFKLSLGLRASIISLSAVVPARNASGPEPTQYPS